MDNGPGYLSGKCVTFAATLLSITWYRRATVSPKEESLKDCKKKIMSFMKGDLFPISYLIALVRHNLAIIGRDPCSQNTYLV